MFDDKDLKLFLLEKPTYHNFPKALEDVAKIVISSGFFKVTNKEGSCCFRVKFIYPFIQRAKFIFTFCFWPYPSCYFNLHAKEKFSF